MKKISIYFIILLSFFIMPLIGNAATYDLTITSSSVNLRKGPGTNYGTIISLGQGSTYTLADNNLIANEKGCPNGWYKIYYSGTEVGYVCSNYATVTERVLSESDECSNSLKALGFTDDYTYYLCKLKNKHPNWNFVPIITNLDFTETVNKFTVCGDAMIQTNNADFIDENCTAREGSFVGASQKGVAYYLNPLNFLNESDIFQFEYLKYQDGMSDKYYEAVNKVLSGASMTTYHANLGNNLAQILNDSAKETEVNVNPVFLASRITQELGYGESEYNLYSGIYAEEDNMYYGYYNFYNIGVTPSCISNYGVTHCGLNYAKNKGWNSVYNALKGGALFLSSSYIAVGQYTAYLQRFNIVPTNMAKQYLHYYMGNLAAPVSEGRNSYNAYEKLGLLENDFVFYIPVYTGMDAIINNKSDVATGEEASDTKMAISIADLVTSSGYTYGNGRISGIKYETGVADVKSHLEAIAGAKNVVVKDQNGNVVTDGLIGTGFKVVVTTESSTEELSVIVKGDTSGDGKINALDLLQVQKKILGVLELSGVNETAGDTSGDGKVNALDLLQIQKKILGVDDIQ